MEKTEQNLTTRINERRRIYNVDIDKEEELAAIAEEHPYIAENVLRKWTEDFVDEDSGEVQSVERNEIVARKGDVADPNMLSALKFHIDTGDIKEVVFSNVRRGASFVLGKRVSPYLVKVNGWETRLKILVKATDIQVAREIVEDYIEQTREGSFEFEMVKEVDRLVVIEDVLPHESDGTEGEIARYYHRMELYINIASGNTPEAYKAAVEKARNIESLPCYNFLVKASDAEAAQKTVAGWIERNLIGSGRKSRLAGTVIKTASLYTVDIVIPDWFSREYIEYHIANSSREGRYRDTEMAFIESVTWEEEDEEKEGPTLFDNTGEPEPEEEQSGDGDE